MNLETTVEEDEIISEARRVFDRLAPVGRFNQPDPHRARAAHVQCPGR
jgi:hypothetical protein